MRRLPRAEIAQKVARALAMVRLEGLADRRTQQLSGGQQQRVAVARALVFEPRLVLLDEPLGALDRQLREQMQYELKHLHQRLGVTMVYVTHDQIEAMTMSDRVAVFSTGKLRQVAEPRRLYEEPELAVRRPVPGREQRACRHGRAPRRRAVRGDAAGRRDDRRHRGRRLRRGRQGRSSCCGRRRWRWAPRRRACVNRFPARVVEATFLGDQLRVRLAALGREDFVLKLPNAAGQSARSSRAPRSRSAGGRRIAVPSSPERRPRAQAAYWLILLPAVLMLVALYLVPLADVLVTSVTDPKPGLDNYALLFTSASVQRTLITTLRIAAITTALALLLGYLVAYAMRAATSRRQRIMLFCVLLPFWISVLVRSFAWLTLLGSQGVINGLLMDAGLIDEPLALVRNETGVLIGMVHVMLPYAILTLYANMLGIDAGLVAAARSLGASRGQAFRMVFLPLTRPGLIGAGTLVFILSLGFFVTPALLGGGKVLMIAEYVAIQINDTLRWGLGTMLAATLMISVLGALWALSRIIDVRRLFGA